MSACLNAHCKCCAHKMVACMPILRVPLLAMQSCLTSALFPGLRARAHEIIIHAEILPIFCSRGVCSSKNLPCAKPAHFLFAGHVLNNESVVLKPQAAPTHFVLVAGAGPGKLFLISICPFMSILHQLIISASIPGN